MKQCCQMEHAERIEGEKYVVLIGNPNTGKSQIFTQLTGLSQKIANFPGITVGYKQGSIQGVKEKITIVDTPGIYGFYPIKPEECAAMDYLHTNSQNLIINILDGTKLNRDLLLTRQILKHYNKDQIIIVVNFADKMRDREIAFDKVKFETLLGTKVLVISSFNSTDTKELKEAIRRKSMEFNIPMNLRSEANGNVMEMIEHDFQWIENNLSDFYEVKSSSKYSVFVNRLDGLLLHQFWGIVIFVQIMFTLFFLTYTLTVPISDYLERLATSIGEYASSKTTNPILQSFITDWAIGGIGFILVFIPQIATLMLFLGILEQSGYTTRVAFVTNKFLARIGISGTSLVPMLMGFGCNVPAIIATKTISDPKERIAIVLANPFLSCSARLPVYVLITSALFPEEAAYIITGLYFGGIVVAIVVIYILRKCVFRGETNEILIELPDLSIPNAKSVLIQTYVQIKRFVLNAATWMALGLLGMWILTITGPEGYIGPKNIEKSWIYSIGNFLSPVFAQFGWDDKLIVALIFGFVAKEIIVATFAMIFSTGSDLGLLQITLQSAFSPLSALSFLVFVLLYTPCIGTFFAIKQELGSKWAWVSLAISLFVAYIISILVFYVGGLFL